MGGGVSGVGTLITDVLDNMDSTNDIYKTSDEIYRDNRDMRINEVKGMGYSIPGAVMGWCVDYINENPGIVNGLMTNYNGNFGEAINQFFEITDNLLMVSDSFNVKNRGINYEIKKNNEVKE